MRGNRWKFLAALAALIGALALGACGDDDDDGGGDTSGGSADVAAAQAAIEPYVGKPSPFPVTEPLEKVPTGAKIAFMDCGTPICALFWDIIQPAGQTMGVDISRIDAGTAADTVNSAFDQVIQEKPDGVIVTAIAPQLWENRVPELDDVGISIVTTGIIGAGALGVEAPQAAEPDQERNGALMADYIVANFGEDSNIALYTVPELSFTAIVADSFNAELEKVCPDCAVREVQIPVATIGNTAPNQVVSDLQANPDTTVAAFAIDEVQGGLPAALQTAGIDVETIGLSPAPTQLQYLKDGQETAALGFDLPVLTWTLVDQMAREITGQPLSGNEAKGLGVIQFLTQEDITFDPSMGWTGYPDFAERFAQLWGVGG